MVFLISDHPTQGRDNPLCDQLTADDIQDQQGPRGIKL
jgi:hypothetical protein